MSAPTFNAATNATVTEAGTNITLTFTEAIRRSEGWAVYMAATDG
ncbi:MAG: hypothetical protein OXL41_05305 [Nitrospinae bacterium]|nr:hypothetical protein [Nitrospinota bacterium]